MYLPKRTNDITAEDASKKVWPLKILKAVNNENIYVEYVPKITRASIPGLKLRNDLIAVFRNLDEPMPKTIVDRGIPMKRSFRKASFDKEILIKSPNMYHMISMIVRGVMIITEIFSLSSSLLITLSPTSSTTASDFVSDTSNPEETISSVIF